MKEPKKAVDYICKGWTKHTLARNYLGTATDVGSPFAAEWCALGAIAKAYPNASERMQAEKKLAVVLKGEGWHSISGWNDHPERTKKQVVAAFCKAGI